MNEETVVKRGRGRAKKEETLEMPGVSPELLKVLSGISDGIETISEVVVKLDKRVKDIETGGRERFKEGAKKEDIVAAQGNRSALDPKINAIVDEMLGEDFGVDVKALGDRPGFRFTLIVPPRLSDNVTDKRPVKDEETGQYKKDKAGEVVFEDYMPEDRRSRIISSVDSYDAIKGHCEKVRGYIVAYFAKVNKPLPEFRVK